jgi:plasmid stabilization system protein ParE
VRVRFTPSARREFLDALDFIRQDSPAAADGVLARSVDGLSQLRDFPDSGRVVPEFPDLPYREVLVNPYRFFYRAVGDTVWIVGVWHDRQLPEPPVA